MTKLTKKIIRKLKAKPKEPQTIIQVRRFVAQSEFLDEEKYFPIIRHANELNKIAVHTMMIRSARITLLNHADIPGTRFVAPLSLVKSIFNIRKKKHCAQIIVATLQEPLEHA